MPRGGGAVARSGSAGTDGEGDQREEQVERQREHDDDERCAEDLLVTAQLQSLDDVEADAAQVHVPGERDGGDDLQRRAAQPADEQRQSERSLDLEQDLPLRHAHGSRRVDGAAVHRLHARVGAGQDGRDREQHEGDDGTDLAAGDAQHEYEQQDEAEARDRSSGSGEPDRDLPALTGVPDEVAQRDRDGRGDEHRDRREADVLADRLRERQCA